MEERKGERWLRNWQRYVRGTHLIPDAEVRPGVILKFLQMLPLHCIHRSIGACGCDHVTIM